MSYQNSLLLALLPLLSAQALSQSPAQGGPAFVQVPGVTDPLGLYDHGGRLFFANLQAATGNEPWSSTYPDGPSTLLGDLNPGADHGCHNGDPEFIWPAALVTIEFGSRVLFSAHEGAVWNDQVNLWISDGTAAGTQHLRTFDKPGGYGYTIRGISVGQLVVFGAYTSSGGWGLWRTDGTPAGTVQMTQMYHAPYTYARAGNSAIFAGPQLGNDYLVWRSDGTPQGTKALEEVVLESSNSEGGAFLGREFFFAGRPQSSDDSELYRSDGSFPGTAPLKDIFPGPQGSRPEDLVRVGDYIYFSANDGVFGRELWRTDGSEEGTVRVTDIQPGSLDSNPGQLTESSGRLFFHAPILGKWRVYSYDETNGLLELGAFELVSEMVAIGTRRVFFAARDTAEVGEELWVTDGTPQGTVLYADLEPGPSYGPPREMTLANGQIFLRLGYLYSISPNPLMAAPAGATADPIGQSCAASGFLPRLSATDPVLGQTVDLALRDAQGALPALILMSLPAAPSDLGSGCTSYLDLASLSVLATSNLDAEGSLDLTLPAIPSDPVLTGLRLTLQAVAGPTATEPLGFDLSNAVLLTLGQ